MSESKRPYDDDKTREFRFDKNLEKDFFNDEEIEEMEDINSFKSEEDISSRSQKDKESYNDGFDMESSADETNNSYEEKYNDYSYNNESNNFAERQVRSSDKSKRTSLDDRRNHSKNGSKKNGKKNNKATIITIVAVIAAIVLIIVVTVLCTKGCNSDENKAPSETTTEITSSSYNVLESNTEETYYQDTSVEETTQTYEETTAEPETEETTEETEEETTGREETQPPTQPDLVSASFIPYKCITPDGEVISSDFNTTLGGASSITLNSDGTYSLVVGDKVNSSGSYTIDGNSLSMDGGYSGTINFDDSGNPVAIITEADGYQVYFN